jgi:hypothetical protein
LTESSVSSAFMKKLRERLPKAVVMKHNDLGLIGMPDASVTWAGLTLWLEYKLEDGPRYSTEEDLTWFANTIRKRLAKAPVQLQTCKKLAMAGNCLYMVWYRGIRLISFFDPLFGEIIGTAQDTNQATSWVESWFLSHRP